MKRTTHNLTKLITALIALTVTTSAASAVPNLDAISTDPAFIAAGDTVGISANIHETQTPDTVWDSDKHLKVVLKPDNRLAREYVTITDDRDESIGFLYPDGAWNQNYQVKVHSDAPTGEYKFELHIQYLENGEPIKIPTSNGSVLTYIEEFSFQVEQEGVDLFAETVSTEPSEPRPGNNYVTGKIRVSNSGSKTVEEIVLKPKTPEGIETSYSKDEKFYISKINPGSSKDLDLGLELSEKLGPGLHWIKLEAEYEDTDSNRYTETLEVPLRVEGRPDLEVREKKISMVAGGTKKIHLVIENTGTQDAESVTARILAEETQPFQLDDRSSYIGEIKAGETGEAVLEVSSSRTAAQKTHSLKVELRSLGDSEEGDNSVYTVTEPVKIKVDGKTTSSLVYLGIAGVLLVIMVLVYRAKFKGGEKNED